ncbi:MAG: GNAT family N-acetyltransferase [Alphaproteobacteria bacterium]
MSALIRPALDSDIEPICTLLHEKMNSKFPRQRWRRLMDYAWMEDKPDFGRVVEDGGRILGFVGMVYSDRLIAGRSERFVSISSWFLDKSLRGRGLGAGLMAAATDDPRITYTNVTSSDRVLAIVEAVGYRVLDADRYLWRRAPGSDTGRPISSLACEWDAGAIRARLDPADRRLIDDHADLPVRPVLVEAGDRRALMFFSVKRKGEDVTYFDLLHTGDAALLAEHGQALADTILPRGAAVLAADCRFVAGAPRGGAPAGAVREALPVARYFKSIRLAPAHIDLLYSELQLLDLKLY